MLSWAVLAQGLLCAWSWLRGWSSWVLAKGLVILSLESGHVCLSFIATSLIWATFISHLDE